MSETDNNWHTNQNWIKNVLSKSGTELVDISKNHVQIITERKNGKKIAHQAKDSTTKNKMVYNPSTPLLIKTEQPSQMQFCIPLQATPVTTTAATASLQQFEHEQQHFETLQTPQQQLHQQQQRQQQLTYLSAPVMQQQQQKQQHTPQTSITTAITLNDKNNMLENIKTELYTIPNTTAIELGGGVSSSTSSSTTKTMSNYGRKTNAVNKPQFKCDQCGMIFGSKSAHTSHTKSHAKNAELCGITATTTLGAIELNEAGLPLGIPKSPTIKPLPNVAAGGDPYQCNVCQKTFAVPARLIRHYRTHTGERPFECDFCHKLFSVKENLQVHRRIHTKERPYKCEVCGRAFEHSGKLHRHMRIHTGERPHKCSVCEKTFIQSGQLVIHMRTHTGEKPYKCPVENCGKGFTCSKQLKVHSRTHTGEKPYHCDICFRDFGYNHVLKLHRVQHYGSKCYKCTICDKTFKSKKEMEAHIKGHANELPDDEEEAVAAASSAVEAGTDSGGSAESKATSLLSSTTSYTASESNSPPHSPQTAILTSAAGVSTPKPKKPRQPRGAAKAVATAATAGLTQPSSPSSPDSVYTPDSHSSNSNASSTTMHSFASTTATPIAALLLPHESETDYQTQPVVITSTLYADEMPTDLRTNTAAASSTPTTISTNGYYFAASTTTTTTPAPTCTSMPAAEQPTVQHAEPPTINPALLEAATIHSRHVQHVADNNDDDDVQAALQIIELHRGRQQQQHPQQPVQQQTHAQGHSQQLTHSYCTNVSQQQLHLSELTTNYDDTHEANLLIEHYRRGELAIHGLHRGYAPVPKYESALPNQQDIVRRIEDAIGLRSSTESPERSSSPESDSIMMADRNVMTLPLRKRKVYMNESPSNNANDNATTTTNNGIGNNGPQTNTKVMRLSSVIQFAKAS